MILWKDKDSESYFQQVNSEDWQAIENGTVTFNYKLIAKTDDVIQIYDESNNINLKLSSVDCKYYDDSNNYQPILFGSWLTIFVQAISIISFFDF